MDKSILKEANIKLNQSISSKQDAIKVAGSILVQQGYVQPEYVDAMLEREKIATTYMGNNIAIPHGTDNAKSKVIKSGVSVVQVPAGVAFGDNTATILFGIAGKGDEHLDILSNIAIFCSDKANVEKLVNAKTEAEIITLLQGGK